MKSLVLYFVGFVAALALIVAIMWGSFSLYRWFNWEFGYSAYVQEMFDTHVKEHHQ